MNKMKGVFIVFIVLQLLVLSCKKEEELEEANFIHQEKKSDFLLPESKKGQVIDHNYYSLSYREEHEQAEWVAYWLNRKDVVSIHRKRPYFINDPMIVSRSASWKNYIRSGYDRGHLCPAGDRRFSKQAFEETFYTSNVTPQKKDFNAGIWNRLEQKVRYWANKYNELYVVTGGVLSQKLNHIGKENVTVPNYFYKIVLNKRGDTYHGIAFLLPHEDSDRPLYEFVVSIDKIEQLTEIDFFPKLPDEIENRLERNQSYREWRF
ncbi:DNA/RNA non-specific endonuclease [Flavobacterium columnare]|uniref:Endonuclease n=1 Tax=Flavobacterium columnare TaxID=996 RepID=A0AAI8GBQ4_9FLAO|nr:DNA/RNA non-specific endonuclease [Flavobacterium columnare]AMO20867.1 DNA/RNA non-specific endonuclease [Flavobacterium columnare]AUX18858.1 endonuclease [Flavobacterium columnare]QOG57942.1 DNA/RNA non-specific endonuclease [Flavobacterium columnare]QOG60664.1 DNA/RNA non-specific endonuclease [Flavobacterium columnare]QOG63384.1 DNA/RNA non-specific endonuclease [Flavobacterium columnare]